MAQPRAISVEVVKEQEAGSSKKIDSDDNRDFR